MFTCKAKNAKESTNPNAIWATDPRPTMTTMPTSASFRIYHPPRNTPEHTFKSDKRRMRIGKQGRDINGLLTISMVSQYTDVDL